jgi:hypothetical protein
MPAEAFLQTRERASTSATTARQPAQRDSWEALVDHAATLLAKSTPERTVQDTLRRYSLYRKSLHASRTGGGGRSRSPSVRNQCASLELAWSTRAAFELPKILEVTNLVDHVSTTNGLAAQTPWQ